MSVVSKTFDEITATIEDAYDDLIAPYYITRKNENKLHLIFKAAAKGFQIIQDAILALKYRFSPYYGADDDIKELARMLGEEPRAGKQTQLYITVTNINELDSQTLLTGTYEYVDNNSNVFSFDVATDTIFAVGQSITYVALSEEVGAFAIEAQDNLNITEVDDVSIPSDLQFSCEDNSELLGNEAESDYDFRQRLINDTDRQDALIELQEAVRGLPLIFECNVVFNPTTTPAVYNSEVTLAPFELLLILTGTVTDAVADMVASKTIFATHQVDSEKVVYHSSDIYVGGKYPVYYTNHSFTYYDINITYVYNSSLMKAVQIEATFATLLKSFQNTKTHNDRIFPTELYDVLKDNEMPGVTIVAVSFSVGGSPTTYIESERSEIARLETITSTGIDTWS